MTIFSSRNFDRVTYCTKREDRAQRRFRLRQEGTNFEKSLASQTLASSFFLENKIILSNAKTSIDSVEH